MRRLSADPCRRSRAHRRVLAARLMLRLEGLTKHYPGRRGTVRAVDGVDLALEAGGSLALVGES